MWTACERVCLWLAPPLGIPGPNEDLHLEIGGEWHGRLKQVCVHYGELHGMRKGGRKREPRGRVQNRGE